MKTSKRSKFIVELTIMDTTKLELQAEHFVNSTLSKFEFLISKPQYDKEGCDLQILDNTMHPTRLIRVQSKGRTFDNSTNIEIPKKYVDDDFILFIYLVDNLKNEQLYIFFPEEIRCFSSNSSHYKIFCAKNDFETKYQSNLFDNEKAEQLRSRLLSAKIKNETTVLIDSFCLENALKSTLRIYKEIYPERIFRLPKTIDIIKNIIYCYDNLNLENRIINVYLFLTPHNFIETTYYTPEELYVGENKIRIFEMRIDGLLSFEIEDFLNRIINSENIILTASDIKYIPLIKQLKNENKNVTLVCEKLDNGLREFGFSWGDISYPIAYSMGLTLNDI